MDEKLETSAAAEGAAPESESVEACEQPAPAAEQSAAEHLAPAAEQPGPAVEGEQPADSAASSVAFNPTSKRVRMQRGFHKAKRKANKKKDAAKSFVYDKTPNRFKNPSELQVRIRTGAVYVGLSVLCTLASDVTFVLLLCVTAGISAGEFFYILRVDSKLPNEFLGVLAAICYPIFVRIYGLAGGFAVSGILLVALLVWYVFWSRARISDVSVSFFGAAYTGLLLSSLTVVHTALPGIWGGVLVCGIFASVWGNDAFAYLVGSRLGKHKMAPRISPKKSWEGFFGGLVGSVLIWCLMTLIPGLNMTLWQAVVCGLVCGLFGVLGDLAESRIKRNSGVKDSGTIMPGHGGLLDRSDSMFLVALVSTVLLVAFGCIEVTI